MGTKTRKKVILIILGIFAVCAAGLVIWFLWGGGKSYIPETVINKSLRKPLSLSAESYHGEGQYADKKMWLKDYKILDLVKDKDSYYVLVDAEFGGNFASNEEDVLLGENNLIRLFEVCRKGFSVRATEVTGAGKSISPGYSVSYYKTITSQLLYGDLKDIAWEPKSDKRLPVDYEIITVLSQDRTLLEKNVKGKKGFILLIDPKEYITEVDVSDAKNNVPGKTLREDIFDID